MLLGHAEDVLGHAHLLLGLPFVRYILTTDRDLRPGPTPSPSTKSHTQLRLQVQEYDCWYFTQSSEKITSYDRANSEQSAFQLKSAFPSRKKRTQQPDCFQHFLKLADSSCILLWLTPRGPTSAASCAASTRAQTGFFSFLLFIARIRYEGSFRKDRGRTVKKQVMQHILVISCNNENEINLIFYVLNSFKCSFRDTTQINQSIKRR